MNIGHVFGFAMMTGIAICFTGAEILNSPGVALTGAIIIFVGSCGMMFWAMWD